MYFSGGQTCYLNGVAFNKRYNLILECFCKCQFIKYILYINLYMRIHVVVASCMTDILSHLKETRNVSKMKSHKHTKPLSTRSLFIEREKKKSSDVS